MSLPALGAAAGRHDMQQAAQPATPDTEVASQDSLEHEPAQGPPPDPGARNADALADAGADASLVFWQQVMGAGQETHFAHGPKRRAEEEPAPLPPAKRQRTADAPRAAATGATALAGVQALRALPAAPSIGETILGEGHVPALALKAAGAKANWFARQYGAGRRAELHRTFVDANGQTQSALSAMLILGGAKPGAQACTMFLASQEVDCDFRVVYLYFLLHDGEYLPPARPDPIVAALPLVATLRPEALRTHPELFVAALNRAIATSAPDRLDPLVKAYVKAGVPLDACAVWSAKQRCVPGTPLHRALSIANPQAVRLLLHHGAKPDVPDADGDMPLHLLPRRIVQALEENGGNEAGEAPLDRALECLRLMLRAGANWRLEGANGQPFMAVLEAEMAAAAHAVASQAGNDRERLVLRALEASVMARVGSMCLEPDTLGSGESDGGRSDTDTDSGTDGRAAADPSPS